MSALLTRSVLPSSARSWHAKWRITAAWSKNWSNGQTEGMSKPTKWSKKSGRDDDRVVKRAKRSKTARNGRSGGGAASQVVKPILNYFFLMFMLSCFSFCLSMRHCLAWLLRIREPLRNHNRNLPRLRNHNRNLPRPRNHNCNLPRLRNHNRNLPRL